MWYLKAKLESIVDFFMPKRLYIRHIASADDFFGPEEPAYFGPFKKYEIEHRLNDTYAELLFYGGDTVEPVLLTWSQARRIPFIASADYWDLQNEELLDADETAAWEDEI